MGKLILKDGKLMKAEDIQKEVEVTIPVPPPQSVDYRQIEAEQRVEEQIRQQQLARQEQERQMREQMIQEQQVYEQQRQPFQQQRQPVYEPPRQQAYEQPQIKQVYAQPREQQRQPEMVTVNILLVTGVTLPITVESTQVRSFMDGLTEAIDAQTSFPINNIVINGRNVVFFMLG